MSEYLKISSFKIRGTSGIKISWALKTQSLIKKGLSRYKISLSHLTLGFEVLNVFIWGVNEGSNDERWLMSAG